MAEFWTDSQSEPSSAKIPKPQPPGEPNAVPEPASHAKELPTVLSSMKPPALAAPHSVSAIVRELAGETLGHFRIDDYVGLGGMGAVFRGTDLRLDRPVALKILAPEQSQDPQVVARFQQEARAAARLDHENIAQVYFIGEDRGVHFIAFEYVEGVNVRDLVQQCGPLPATEAVNYALQITGALMHAADRGVVHRDIKPSNIIITRSGRAKLVDMGLARNFERRSDGGLTESGVTLGTFDYISPEQARDPRSADVRSDVYSLGCTLFHMLTGRPPYPEGTVLQKLLKHQEDIPPDPRCANHRVPANLAAVVTRMMAKDPVRRYQTADELLSELLEVAAGLGLKSTSPEGLIWVTDLPQSPLTWTTGAVWLATVAALVLVVIGVYGRPGAQPEPSPAASPLLSAGAVEPSGQENPFEPADDDSTQSTNNRADRTASLSPDLSDTPDRTRQSPAQPRGGFESGGSSQHNAGTSANPSGRLEVIRVGPDQDMRPFVEQAPSGSIIEISGEYRPQATHRLDETAGIRIEGKRLTIRALAGTQPQIRLSHDEQTASVSDWTLFTLVDSQVEFEGIYFEIRAADAEAVELAVCSLHSSEVTLRRCSFFEPGGHTARPQDDLPNQPLVWVAHLDSGIDAAGQVLASKLIAEGCFFGGGSGAFALDGPAKLDLRECTLLPYDAPVLVRSVGFPPSVAAAVKLANVSLFGGGAPVIDLQFAHAAVDCDETVFTHESPVTGALVRINSESQLEWKGRRNLYHGLRHFLVSQSETGYNPQVASLAEWTNLPEVTEAGSRETSELPWEISLTEARARSPDDLRVAGAFRLAHEPNDPTWRPVGARFVLPWGPLYPVSPLDLTAVGVDVAVASTDRATPATVEQPQSAKVGGPTEAEPNVIASKPAVERSDGSRSPMPVAGPLIVDPQDRGAFASLGAACARADNATIIEIRHDGLLREAPLDLGDRHLTIRAAQGVRPMIEFVVNAQASTGLKPRLVNMARGNLVLRDLDLHVTADSAVNPADWTVIASRGADVTLENCTVTVESPGAPATRLVWFVGNELEDPMMDPTQPLTPVRSQLQVRNSLVVGAANLVRADSGVHLRVELENCAVEVDECLLKVSGSADRFVTGTPHELELHRNTIRTPGGLVRCDAGATRPWVPRIEVSATDNILVGSPSAPWMQFQISRPVHELGELLRWRGVNNTYDGMETVWTIEAMGSAPERYDWPAWVNSAARDEKNADRSPVEFVQSSDGVPVAKWTRNHFKPSPVRTAAPSAASVLMRGADVRQIPAPPQER